MATINLFDDRYVRYLMVIGEMTTFVIVITEFGFVQTRVYLYNSLDNTTKKDVRYNPQSILQRYFGDWDSYYTLTSDVSPSNLSFFLISSPFVLVWSWVFVQDLGYSWLTLKHGSWKHHTHSGDGRFWVCS